MVLSEFTGAFAGGASVNIIIRAIDEYSKTFSDVNKSLIGLGTAITAFGVAGAGAIASVTKQAANFEQTKVAFTTMLGSEEQALKTLKDLTDFAARTPFTIPGIEKSAKQLMAVGFEAEDLIPTLKAVGDVASGLSLGEEGLQRLILNLGQVKTQGKLTGRELRDFAVNGVPLIDELAKSMGKTKVEIMEMTSAGEIGFEDVMKAFSDMTGEGGLFFDMMDKQSKTLNGQISNITDSFIKIARIMGEVFLPAAKWVAEQLQILIGFMEEHPKLTQFAAVLLGVTTALALIIGPILILIGLLPLLIAGFGVLSAVTLPITGTILLIGAAIVGVIALFIWWKEVCINVAKVFMWLAGVLDKGVQLIKDGFAIGFSYIGNFVKDTWNNVVDSTEWAVNKVIDAINILVDGYNRIARKLNLTEIDPLKNVDFSGAKAQLTDISKLMDDLSKQREERATNFELVSSQLLLGLKDKWGLEQDLSNTRNMGTSEVVVNIENLNGMDPEEISRALSKELSNKISL